MNIKEYNEIKDLKYYEYVDYLQNKYGKPNKPYFKLDDEMNWVTKRVSDKIFLDKETSISRLKDGLVIHHVKEDKYYELSDKYRACFYHWINQSPCNLVYCDLLEHLLLHIMINEENPERKIPKHLLYDVYWCITGRYPQLRVHNSPNTYQQDLSNYKQHVINNNDVVLALVQRTKNKTTT